jgi:hypothetical protein
MELGAAPDDAVHLVLFMWSLRVGGAGLENVNADVQQLTAHRVVDVAAW